MFSRDAGDLSYSSLCVFCSDLCCFIYSNNSDINMEGMISKFVENMEGGNVVDSEVGCLNSL